MTVEKLLFVLPGLGKSPGNFSHLLLLTLPELRLGRESQAHAVETSQFFGGLASRMRSWELHCPTPQGWWWCHNP